MYMHVFSGTGQIVKTKNNQENAMAGNFLQRNIGIKGFFFLKSTVLFFVVSSLKRTKPEENRSEYCKFLFITSLTTEGWILRMGPTQVSKEERLTIYYLFPQRHRA